MIIPEKHFLDGRKRGIIKTQCEIMDSKSCDPCYCKFFLVKGNLSYTEVQKDTSHQ